MVREYNCMSSKMSVGTLIDTIFEFFLKRARNEKKNKPWTRSNTCSASQLFSLLFMANLRTLSNLSLYKAYSPGFDL
jgi:hypothetical protein